MTDQTQNDMWESETEDAFLGHVESEEDEDCQEPEEENPQEDDE